MLCKLIKLLDFAQSLFMATVLDEHSFLQDGIVPKQGLDDLFLIVKYLRALMFAKAFEHVLDDARRLIG